MLRSIAASTNFERSMWREPSEVDNLKSTLEKDSSAAARSAIRRQPTIRRPSRHSSRTRGAGVLSSFHSQILDEIQRGISEPQLGVRSPVLNLGISEDGLDLDSSQREALNRGSTRLSAHPRRSRSTRDQALNDLLGRSEPQSRSAGRGPSPSFTPNFAPAIAYHTSVSSHPSPDSVRLPPLIRLGSRTPDPASHTPSTMLRDYRNGSAPYRSLGHYRSHREGAIDGLGDRQRSLSPDGERESDAWDTLLSTITPDANLPSTDTSFSSTFPSATDVSRHGTSRRSGASSQTQPSSLSSSRTGPPELNFDVLDHLPCDFFSDDDEDTPVNHHRVSGSSGIPLSLRRSPGLHSTMSSHPPIPTISFSFSDSGDSDLQQMQAILDRLARREDIPDDWWAGAGLSRTMGRGLSASAEANENDNAE